MNQRPPLPSDFQADARAHLLGGITSAYAAHDSLMRGDLRAALIEVDRAIVLAHEARKFLLATSVQKTAGPAAAILPELPGL